MGDFQIRGEEGWPEKVECGVHHNIRHPTPDLTMAEIIAILSTLGPHLTPRTLNQLTLVVEALLAMTGRVTMLGLSRWTEKGGSYRTVQRFFKEKIDWPALRWQLVKQHLTGSKEVWLLAGDEVMVTKSGKETHGLGIFFLRFTTSRCRACAF
jgi:putative transposase